MSILPFNPDTTFIGISMSDLSATETAFLEKDQEIANLTKEKANIQLESNQFMSERNRETARADALKSDLDKKQVALDEANLALAQSKALAIKLQAEINLLKGATQPTPAIPPIPTTLPGTHQKITRTSLGRWAGYTIEHGKTAPSPTQNAYARKAMDWGKGIGLDLYRVFLNTTEAPAMAAMTIDNPENIIGYGRKLGLRYIADTMDTIVSRLLAHDALKAYCDAVIKMGCEGFFINDADRAALPFETLKVMISRLRAAVPDMPIFVSLLGSANIDLFKTVADYVEIQTFGTVGELATFLKRGVIPCLDLRKPLTVEDLKARATIALQYPPPAFFFYSDLVTDYDQMPDLEDEVIRDFVVAWKKLSV